MSEPEYPEGMIAEEKFTLQTFRSHFVFITIKNLSLYFSKGLKISCSAIDNSIING